MVPARFAGKALESLTRDGTAVTVTRETIKGVDYAMFPATGGNYVARYATDTTPPQISAVTPTSNASTSATITWTTDEASDSKVLYGTSPAALNQTATSGGNVTSHSVTLSGLSGGTTYSFRVQSADGSGNTTTSPATSSAPASFTTPVTAFPAATTIETGTLRGGTFAALAADDTTYFQVTSTTSGTRTTGWYGSFTGISAGATNLRVTYTGLNSRSCTQVLAAWRWTDSTWQQLASQAVGTTDVTLADLAPSGAASGYISATGEVRVRARCTTTANFFTSGDLLRLVYTKP
jgi:hypothetical protein